MPTPTTAGGALTEAGTPPLGPAAPPAPTPGLRVLVTVAVLSAGMAALYFGRDILIPLALAALLSFMLGPLVSRLRRLGLPRIPAVLLVVSLTFGVLGGFGLVVGTQLAQLAENLPTYQRNIQAKIRSLQTMVPSGGIFDRTSEMFKELSEELQKAQEQQPDAATTSSPSPGGRGRVVVEQQRQQRPGGEEPLVVRVEEPQASPFQVFREIAVPLLAPIGTAGIIIVVVIFMLLEREDLRDRLIRLVGGGNLHQTTEALNDAGKRVSRYLLMQLVVNATYGIPVGVGLWLIGVPNALLWGLLATVLRFVPYIGPWIAALFPIALSVAVDPGWTMVLWTIAIFLALELVSNNVVEPWLYGASTGISTVAILVAAIFWTALWGPIGLLLSTPLTVLLAVVGRHVPQLGFFDVLLGSEPVLAVHERFYQRMLAGDPDEGEEIAEEFVEDRPLAAFYDEVAMPALRLAEADRAADLLVGEGRATCTDSFVRVVEGLADHEDPEDAEAAADAAGAANTTAALPPSVAWTGKPVACIAGRTGLDRAAAAMLAQLLERRGIGARVLPSDAVSPAGIASLDLAGVELVVLSYLGGSAVTRARQVSRRLRRKAPGVRIMVGLWSGQLGKAGPGTGDKAAGEETAAGLSADLVATSLAQAVARVVQLAAAADPASAGGAQEADAPAPVEAGPSARRLAREAIERATRELAQAFAVPVCLVSLAEDDEAPAPKESGRTPAGASPAGATSAGAASAGAAAQSAAAGEAPREASICGQHIAAGETLIVADVLKDKRFADNHAFKERGVRFYATATLRASTGPVLGTLCLFDTEPRTVSDRERQLLRTAADEVAAEIERRRPPAAAATKETAAA
jgi:predicted PurR-regulated permease PerM